MEVSPEDPHPYQLLRVVARDGFVADRSITAEYAVGGRVLGYATRVIRVGTADTVTPRRPTPEPGSVWVLPADGAERPDLEIVIKDGNDGAGGLVWRLRSRHAGVAASAEYTSRLPGAAKDVKRFLRGIEDRKAADDLPEHLGSFGLRIAAAVPEPVMDAVRAAAKAVAGPPAVLLASEEPHVPWELAHVRNRWDPAAPPVLGAQTVLGRWTYGQRQLAAGSPATLDLATMGVVTGEYRSSGLRLPEADQEAEDIRSRYGGTALPAGLRPILDALATDPTHDVLHFALHGSAGSAQGTNEGLRLTDTTWLSSESVRTVFLNACQLGQGATLLGEYAGMAAALISLGVGAVVAPLWKVDDAVAREVAEDFYEAVFRGDVQPAEQLRRERVETLGKERSPAGTRLAYIYFGHPCLRVTWTGRRGDT